MKRRKPGRLRHICQVQEDTSDAGAIEPTWCTWKGTIPCHVEDISGAEQTSRSQQAEATITTVVTMRHLQGLRPTMRLLFANRSPQRTLNVVRILRDGQGHNMEVECQETPDAR